MRFETRLWNVCFGADTSLEAAIAAMPEGQSMPEFAAEQVSRAESEGLLQTALRQRHIAALLQVLQEDVGEPTEDAKAKEQSLPVYDEGTPEQLREDFLRQKDLDPDVAIMFGKDLARVTVDPFGARCLEELISIRNHTRLFLAGLDVTIGALLLEETRSRDTGPPEDDDAAPPTLTDLEAPSEEA